MTIACLGHFRYILFGVQSYHYDVRDKVVDFMKKNKPVLKKIEADPQRYLKSLRMEQEGSCSTDTEVRTFATICDTTVFVYCNHGSNQNYLLVNSEVDLNIVKEVEKVEDVYVMHFKDCPYKIKGLERQIEEIGPYIFNLLCEWEDLEETLGEKKSKYDTLDS